MQVQASTRTASWEEEVATCTSCSIALQLRNCCRHASLSASPAHAGLKLQGVHGANHERRQGTSEQRQHCLGVIVAAEGQLQRGADAIGNAGARQDVVPEICYGFDALEWALGRGPAAGLLEKRRCNAGGGDTACGLRRELNTVSGSNKREGRGWHGTSREDSKLVMQLQPPATTNALEEGGRVNMRARRRERADRVAGRREEGSRVKSETEIR